MTFTLNATQNQTWNSNNNVNRNTNDNRGRERKARVSSKVRFRRFVAFPTRSREIERSNREETGSGREEGVAFPSGRLRLPPCEGSSANRQTGWTPLDSGSWSLLWRCRWICLTFST